MRRAEAGLISPGRGIAEERGLGDRHSPNRRALQLFLRVFSLSCIYFSVDFRACILTKNVFAFSIVRVVLLR